MRYQGQRVKIGPPPSVPALSGPPPAPARPARIEVVVCTEAELARVMPGFDCTECPEDPRPHLHCPWGGMHKHYADEVQQ
jgi:hypothetical protein